MAGGKKEHVDKVRESKFNRQRCETAELRANCGKDGYVFTNTVASGPNAGAVNAAGQCEFHHVLPITSLQDASIMDDGLDAEEKDFIHKCMAKTTWDINKQPNLIGLPTKRPYEKADREVAKEKDKEESQKTATAAFFKKLKAVSGQFGALPDLPCHLNDHPKYTAAIISKLDEAVWPKLLDSREECKDKGKNIRKVLVDQSKHWKDWLVQTRGVAHEGAADCWVNREKKRDVWFIPLSMDPGSPKKQDPPPNIFLTKKPKVRAWLKAMFSAVA
jgi:hypothetical protein